MVTIALADDFQMVREGIRHILNNERDFQVVAEVEDGLTAVELVQKQAPDILLLEIIVPRLHGLDVIEQLRGKTRTKIIVLSTLDFPPYVIEAFRTGAAGYILKRSASAELIECIRIVSRGKLFISPSLQGCAPGVTLRTHLSPSVMAGKNLTIRETLVLQFSAEGENAHSIANRLFVSRRTIECHRYNAMKKLGLRTQTDLVRYAIGKRIISV